jgi:hypothetical protein
MLAAAVLLLAGCGATSPGSVAASIAARSEPNAMSAVTTVDGVQQFDVPPGDRASISQGVRQLLGEPIQSAQISNGWRTSAAGQGAGGYSTCVQATTATSQHMLVVVQSGSGTRQVRKDPAASQVCADQTRVVHWTKLNEAMAGAAE